MKRFLSQQLVVIMILVFILLNITWGEAKMAFEQVQVGSEQLLLHKPAVTGFKGAAATVEFETLIKTPASVVYYGTVMPDEDIRLPQYRIKAREVFSQGIVNSQKHKLSLNISQLESYSCDPGLVVDKGGVIVYRIEVYDPHSNASRFYDHHFCYKREGEPGTGTYSLCTTVTEGPFVDKITHNSAVISWNTDNRTRGSVVVEGTEYESKTISPYHEVMITDLRPARRYQYFIRSDDNKSALYSFQTAPYPGSQHPFSFAFMSDSRGGAGGGERSINGVNYKVLSHFMTQLYNKKVNLILFGGDLIHGYVSHTRDFQWQLETWKQSVQPVGASIAIYEIMGNHEQAGLYYKIPDPDQKGTFFLAYTDREGQESAEAIFAREFVNPLGSVYNFGTAEPENRADGVGGFAKGPDYSENVYSFNYGNIHFVGLNTNYWYTGQRPYKNNNRPFNDKKGISIALKHLGGNREGYIRDNQLKWLQRDLRHAQDDDTIDWVFVFLHEPPFPNGGHVQDAMFWGIPGKGGQGGYNDHDAPLGDVIDMRNRFLKIISNHNKVVALLAGDEHNYSRTLIDSTICKECDTSFWQITSGGVGAPYYVQDTSVPWVHNVKAFAPSKNYCVFTVEGTKPGLTVYSDTDQVLDKVDDLALIKHKTF